MNIFTSLQQGKSNLGKLSRKLGISRERVSQIYYRILGSEFRGDLQKKRARRLIDKRRTKMKSTKFICAACGKKVNHLEGKFKHKYCQSCHNKSQDQRKMTVTWICDWCGKSYHPLKTGSDKGKHFCKKAHYVKYSKKQAKLRKKNEKLGNKRKK